MKGTAVFIIDDHPAMRHGLSRLLQEELGMRVFAEAGNRQEVLNCLEKGKPDLVIMDLELGDGSPSGFDLVKELKALLGEIPILVYTMHDEAFYRERSFSAGADGFISKKGEVLELLAAIPSVLEGNTWGIVSTGVEPLTGPWNLSQREFEVFNLLGQGKSAKAISEILNIGCKTVESHKYSIRKKMEFTSVEELRQYAIKWRHAGTR
jgi:DNA-binding NarL/FixJ family response regulator